MFNANRFTIDQNLSYPELINDFLEQRKARRKRKKAFIGATVYRNFDRLLYIWSDARFIHIIRDPRDVARSCSGMGWAGNVWYGIDRWIEVEKLWDKLKTTISLERCIEVHYENLICEPEKSLTSICRFLNLTYNCSMLDYDRDTTYSKPDSSLIEQWRKKLSDSEIQLVEAKVGGLLIQKEYLASGLPQVKVSKLAQKKLSLQNWWYKTMFRVNRFGLPLFMAEYISRKLGLKSWQKQNQSKINKIVKSQLK